MTSLDFLSLDLARAGEGHEPAPRSPLEHALRWAGTEIEDSSQMGKLEVRGQLDGADLPDGTESVRLSPTRALVLCPPNEVGRVRAELRERFGHVVDVTGALAGIRVRGEQLLRRLTDLDLDSLPAAGAVARVPAIVLRDGDAFRIFFAQEYGDYVVEVVLDTAKGLA